MGPSHYSTSQLVIQKVACGGETTRNTLFMQQRDGRWIEDQVDTETAVARKLVEDAQSAIMQVQENMRNAGNVGLTTTKPTTTFEKMLNSVGESLSNLVSSEDGEDGEDEGNDEVDPQQG